FLNLVGGTQPLTLKKYFPRIAIDQGLASRMLFVVEHGAAKKVIDPRPTKDEVTLRSQLLTRLKRISDLFGEYTPTDQWVAAYADWYDRFPNSVGNPKLADYAGRKATHLKKLSIICSASRTLDRQLLAEDFKRALFVLDKTEERMGEVLDGVGPQDRFTDLVAEVMANLAVLKECSFAEIFGQVFRRCKELDLVQVLNSLQQTGHLELSDYRYNEGRLIISRTKTRIKWLDKEKNAHLK
ncbi:MAG TPA: hypothetical protein VJ044_19545, partial [Candidatus Hodarchaeales archaeon]|nr:hypothetical protein [Candidatus Hodarchaeales archaeon]